MNKTVEVYISFWKSIFDIMLNHVMINNGRMSEVSFVAMKHFFDAVDSLMSQLRSIKMDSVAVATVMETLYGIVNDIPYVSSFNHANSKHIRVKFSEYVFGKIEYKEFKKEFDDMLSNYEALCKKSHHTEEDKSYMAGYLEVHGVFIGVFQYFITKEEFLFIRAGDGKLAKIKDALKNGENPKVSMFGMDMYPFYNRKIVELMIKAESHEVGPTHGKFGEYFTMCDEFKKEYFKQFEEGMRTYEKIGFSESIGLWQDVESCRAKIASVKCEHNVCSDLDSYRKLVSLKNKMMNMEVCELLDIHVSKDEMSKVKKEIETIESKI